MGEVHPIADQLATSEASNETQSKTPNTRLKKPAKAKRRTTDKGAKPTEILPTTRIAFSKQLDILRAYAAIFSATNRIVANKDVADRLNIQASTISLSNPFMVSVGLLLKAGGSFTPTENVMAFLRAYEWNPEAAAQKLAPTLRETWFHKVIAPLVAYSPISEDEAIQKLAEASSAGPEYRPELRFLLMYLAAVGLIERDGGQVRSVRSTNGEAAAAATPRAESPLQDKPEQDNPRIATAFTQSPEGIVQFHISIRVGMGEFGGWSPERISAFFSGIAQVLAAKAEVEKKA
ncbi:MAG: hypothetical protein ABSH40_01550 [Bryobacteraceae bacterium]|jgi:hypothetical protein